jgi:hypothetical protein
MARQICTCGHTDEQHSSVVPVAHPQDPHRVIRPDLGADPISKELGETGHGPCLLCKCKRFTWKSWTPEYLQQRARLERLERDLGHDKD